MQTFKYNYCTVIVFQLKNNKKFQSSLTFEIGPVQVHLNSVRVEQVFSVSPGKLERAARLFFSWNKIFFASNRRHEKMSVKRNFICNFTYFIYNFNDLWMIVAIESLDELKTELKALNSKNKKRLNLNNHVLFYENIMHGHQVYFKG